MIRSVVQADAPPDRVHAAGHAVGHGRYLKEWAGATAARSGRAEELVLKLGSVEETITVTDTGESPSEVREIHRRHAGITVNVTFRP